MLNNFFPKKTDKDDYLTRRFVEDGVIETRSFGDIVFDSDVWSCGPQDNRTWKWTLHSFSFLDPMIAVGKCELLTKIVRSWNDRFSQSSTEDDFPWHDHATALRLDRISRMAIQFSDYQFSELAGIHATLLLRDDFYSKNTNHGFDQAISLILASLVFSNNPDSILWREIGLDRLKNEIAFAFTSEGVHVENSPAYHMGMIGNMLRARRLLSFVKMDHSGFDELFDKALTFLVWVTRPDRFLVYLGDSVSYRPSVAQELADLPSAPMVEWVSSGGKTGKKPVKNFMVYAQSGYAVYRSSWENWPGHTHIVLKSGFLSRYHRQDDDLNILLHAYGEDWLIDSGLYNHNQKDPIRIYMRSVKAHNVLYLSESRIDRQNYGAEFANLREIEVPGYCHAVEGITSMYTSGKVSRKLLIKNKDEFRLVDTLLGFSENKKYWMFHFPLDKKVRIDDGFVKVYGKNKILAVKPNLSRVPVSVYKGFNKSFPSLVSYKINHKEDSQVVVFGPCFEEEIIFDFCFS